MFTCFPSPCHLWRQQWSFLREHRKWWQSWTFYGSCWNTFHLTIQKLQMVSIFLGVWSPSPWLSCFSVTAVAWLIYGEVCAQNLPHHIFLGKPPGMEEAVQTLCCPETLSPGRNPVSMRCHLRENCPWKWSGINWSTFRGILQLKIETANIQVFMTYQRKRPFGSVCSYCS